MFFHLWTFDPIGFISSYLPDIYIYKICKKVNSFLWLLKKKTFLVKNNFGNIYDYHNQQESTISAHLYQNNCVYSLFFYQCQTISAWER